MTDQEPGYYQLLRKEIQLFKGLAEIRSKQNQLHEAKMLAWDECRHKLTSSRQFEELWQKAKPPGTDNYLREKERELISELKKIERLLEHLRFAGLGDTRHF